MSFGNRHGSEALRHFERAFFAQEVLNAELRGKSRYFHISGQGGCLEVALTKITRSHACEVPLRTLSPDEEALFIINCFFKLLDPKVQDSLKNLLKDYSGDPAA